MEYIDTLCVVLDEVAANETGATGHYGAHPRRQQRHHVTKYEG